MFSEPAWEGWGTSQVFRGLGGGAAFKFEGAKGPLKTLVKVLAPLFRKKKKKNPYII